MGSSVSWKSNGCFCILSPSVASVRLAEDVYLRCVKGGGEEEEKEGKREAVMELSKGHPRKTCRPDAIIRNLTTNDNSSGVGAVINCLLAGAQGFCRVRDGGDVRGRERRW